MAIIEQIFVDFAKKIEGSVWPANFLGVMQKSHLEKNPQLRVFYYLVNINLSNQGISL